MKRAIAVVGTVFLLMGAGVGAANAAEGNAYGKVSTECVATLGASSLGAGIQAGKLAHPGAKMTAKSIAESVHCAG